MSSRYRNPIIPGFYPDPSVCRVDEDYYLVTSTFEYFPGLPIFHSRDLVHWRQIGHVLDRPSQLDLDGIRPSGGLYAPTIRYHDGRFYVINTLVDGKRGQHANFIVTATDPAGPWSEPYWLDGAPGIDPSLLFDDDGRAWYCSNRMAVDSQFEGHTEIYVQELNLAQMQLMGEPQVIWEGAVKGAVWSEAPHIYKIDGAYFLLTAEGGTAHHHAVVVARSKIISGPYEGNRGNPILTHRHLGMDYPIVGTGHADLVQTQNGEWWMVLLAMRPYGGYYYNLGRETFLVPVVWEDGWPIISPGTGRVESEYSAPDLAQHNWPTLPVCDQFETEALALHWNFLRTPRDEFYSLSERPGFLRLHLRPQKLSELANPSFVGRRQQHINFCARTVMEFTPRSVDECAGVVLLQNNNFHFRCVVTQNNEGARFVRLIKRDRAEETLLAEQAVRGTRFYFKVEAREQAYSFYLAMEAEKWQPVAEAIDGRILSTPVAGGFVGAYIGMYASSNGSSSQNWADYDWFEYMALA
jgi:xylan 1,4-beta-xylosidase